MALSTKAAGRREKAPSLAVKAVLAAIASASFPAASALAQNPGLAPELVARMAKEKEARSACKLEICSAFAKPGAGAPIACEATKTWPHSEIIAKIVGGSYIWRYGHMQCSVKLSLDRSLIAKAVTEAKATVSFPEHAFVCVVDDKDAAKGQAFTVSVRITPVVSFEKGQAKSVQLEPVKTEGSTLASAAVTSIMTVDKASGFVSRSAAAEINSFLYERCKEDGVEIARKQ
jgi:hypothetical protein